MPAARFVMALIAIGASALSTSNATADETGMAAMHDWRAERGKACFVDHFHSGTGEGPTKAAARKAAITDWEGFTAFEYGSDWARFRSAGSRGIDYEKTAKGWRANVEARPCRKQIRSSRKR
jgi:hypothetical protein